MRRTSRAAPRFFTGLALASALCLPAAALAAQFDFYIKLPPIEGDSGKGASMGGEMEIQSFSWGATQTSHQGKVMEVAGLKYEADVIDSPASDGEAEITLKGNAAKRLPGKRTPPTVTLKRGTSAAAAGGVRVAAGDIDGDSSAGVDHYYNPKELTVDKSVPGPAASGLATGKRMHKPRMVPAPLAAGSLTVSGKFPGCTVGARYPSLELGDRAARYTLQDVVVTSCGGSSGGAQPMEEVSFNYAKIKT